MINNSQLTSGDKQVVSNIRYKFRARVTDYSDERIAHAWRQFSTSEDYPDEEKFVDLWLADDLGG